MSIGWIDNIYNNSTTQWQWKSVDDRHNGAITPKDGSGDSYVLDDAQFHPLKPQTSYSAEWCGIPWYYEGKHFKVLSKDGVKGVIFYTSEIGEDNWIIYEELGTGRVLVKQRAPNGSDFHCNLRFESDGLYIDIVNNHAFSGENALYLIYNEYKQWVQAIAPIAGQIIGAIGQGAAAGIVAGV